MSKYHTMTQIQNIRKEKRKCAQCGREIKGYGYFYVSTIARGKHLCRTCENRQEGKQNGEI